MAVEQVAEAPASTRTGAAHRAEIGIHLLRFRQAGVDAAESPTASAPAAIKRRDQFVIDAAREDLQHGVDRLPAW